MHITITAQKFSKSGGQSVDKLVGYLEKENEGLDASLHEHFFDQNNDMVNPENVVKDIDGNTKKLKKVEPKFYSLTINPSKKELQIINNLAIKEVEILRNNLPVETDNNLSDATLIKEYTNHFLKEYVRESMREYASSFKNEINGRSVNINDIKYYAKIESSRTYKGNDKQVIENAPFRKELRSLELKLSQVELGKQEGNVIELKNSIQKLHENAPHKINGKMIMQGMQKEGFQSHIHVIVSRKDASNNYSLSPGSKYKASESILNGKIVKRGFDRDGWIGRSEKTFDKMFDYNRNYVLSYQGKKDAKDNPKLYWETIKNLPLNEKNYALKVLGIPVQKNSKIGQNLSNLSVNNTVNHAKKVFVPDEVKEAMKIIDDFKSGRIPNTQMSIAEINSFIKDANKVMGLLTKGAVVPEPTAQAARIITKYAVKLIKAVTRGSGLEIGM